MQNDLMERFGPLSHLIGVWEGSKGDDIAPSDDRGTENNKYREVLTFEDAGLTQNHEQSLWVLRYSTKIYRLGEPNTFHEEVGYWTWEPKTPELLRCFTIPRGIALIAGGKAEKNATSFQLRSERGSPTFGICANPFLDKEFKMVAYELDVKIINANTFSYEQDTVIQMLGHSDLFHHRDKNILSRKK